jgi:serine/threonine protein kinase/Tfp pilus assembly protein PilF
MNVSAGRRTWEEATSPAAVHLAQEYEKAWRDSVNAAKRPDLHTFLSEAGIAAEEPGTRLALLRADMVLRWEIGEKVGAHWYLERYCDLGEDTIVALAYEEFCLRQDDRENPDPAEYLSRYAGVAGPLGRVLEIHDLIGSGTTVSVLPSLSADGVLRGSDQAFPEAGQSIAGFSLVEELGRGSFARVFLAREHQLADRPVALKVARRGSHEPQTLARLQHTHIVPVHSHRIDADSGLHLLCMPYFGRITLARILADDEVQDATTGATLVKALDRLEPAGVPPFGRSAGRAALERRSYAQAIAWWGARLADALEHAHDRGVLHRDIKPSNVLVTSDGMPMLLDFNLAREPELAKGTATGSAAPGGTIDYMSPEHLRALVEGTSDALDGRADIYGLGVVLYEAVTGKRPFSTPRRGASIVDVLVRAIDERYRPLPRLRQSFPEIPPAFESVIRRAIAPDPALRYQSAAALAADLQSVADDLPLLHAREPWLSRASGWFRRKQRRIVAALAVALAALVGMAVCLGLLVDRSSFFMHISVELRKGNEASEKGDFTAAKVHFDAAERLANRLQPSLWGYVEKLRDFRSLGSKLTGSLRRLPSEHDIEELKVLALEKSQLAERIGRVRNHADALDQAADSLRFRFLLGEGSELTRASRELQELLEPFFVLENSDWINLNHTLTLLKPERRDRLPVEVNELLFLWMAAIESSLAGNRDGANQPRVPVDQAAVVRALSICERAIEWVEPKAPWQALEEQLEQNRSGSASAPALQRLPAGILPFPGEPLAVTGESSALACFQWGLLSYRAGRGGRAIDWLERAARLEWNNYWYQFMLAFLEDKAGLVDDALDHYSVAVALKPESPGVRFSRARLYRSKGRWDWAVDDLVSVLAKLDGSPEESQVRLELGYLYQELGNFTSARSEYDKVIALDKSGTYGKAARLNQANIAAESAEFERAKAEYDTLLALDPEDTATRLSRGLLELRQSRPDNALVDLTTLMERKSALKNPDEVLAARALAHLLVSHAELAVADAAEAKRLRPTPAHERLRQRALLAARRFESVELDRPEDFGLLPLAGRRLTLDLRAAADGLGRLAHSRREESYRATVSRAVILAALGERTAALSVATRALDLSPYSPRAYLIRARVKSFGGDREGAWADVERGLAIQTNEPGLLELRGVLRAQAGDPLRALEDYNKALESANFERTHLHKARALESAGRLEDAVLEWSLTLRRDPELPEAYLGRAQAQMSLGRWDLALADLEQAASWAHSDPRIELGVVTAYFRCLQARPDRAPRWLALARRAARDVWGVLAERVPIRVSAG